MQKVLIPAINSAPNYQSISQSDDVESGRHSPVSDVSSNNATSGSTDFFARLGQTHQRALTDFGASFAVSSAAFTLIDGLGSVISVQLRNRHSSMSDLFIAATNGGNDGLLAASSIASGYALYRNAPSTTVGAIGRFIGGAAMVISLAYALAAPFLVTVGSTQNDSAL